MSKVLVFGYKSRNMKDLVKNGPKERRNIADPAIWEQGARITVNHSRCGRAQFIAERVSELPEFQSFDSMRDALNPGGVFVVMSDGISFDGTGPADSVLSWLPTTLQGEDMSIRTGQISSAMLEVGFGSTEVRVLPDEGGMQGHGPVEMTVGRKKA